MSTNGIPNLTQTRRELLNYLADVIAYMIENRLDYLLSLLYRLDVAEDKINRALMPGNAEDANVALARCALPCKRLTCTGQSSAG